MFGVRSAGHLKMPASLLGTSALRTLSRRELFLWVVAILATSVLLRVHPGRPFAEAFVEWLASYSAFQYLAWYAVFRLLADSPATCQASRRDIASGLLASLMTFLPAATFTWLSIAGMGLYLSVSSRGEKNAQAAGVVLLALSFNGFWGPRLFDVLAFPLLQADVALVGGILSLTQPEISWQGTLISSNTHRIVVYGPCSSFHNISLSLLCWVALTKLVRPEWRARDATAALLVGVAVLTLNTLRLCFMALGPTQFTYWHAGFGAELFAWATSAIVIGITLLYALGRFARS